MNKLARIYLSKLNGNKIILNNNVHIKNNYYDSNSRYYLPYNFALVENLFIDKINNESFFNDNLEKIIKAHKIYFMHNPYINKKSNDIMIKTLNKYSDKKIYINDIYYNKYISQLENYEKFKYGFSIYYEEQIRPIDIDKLNKFLEMFHKEELKYK
jgi:hypothetical protein